MDKTVTLGWVINNDAPLITAADVARLQSIGAKAVRFELRLAGHTSWDSGIISLYQGVLSQLYGVGISAIGLVTDSAVPGPNNKQVDWNKNATETGGTSGTNLFQTTYASTIKTLASAFPSVSKWEIFNEPNNWASQPSPGVYTGNTFMYPTTYAQLLTRAYAAVKSANPAAVVISGGLEALTSHGVDYVHSAAQYLYDIYTAGQWYNYNAPLDAVGYHYYGEQGGPVNLSHLQSYLTYLRDTVAWFESPAKRAIRPIYLTETGWQSASVGVDQQAANLTALYNYLAHDPNISAVSWFTYLDNPAIHASYGLFDSTNNIKPSGTAFMGV